MKTTLTIPDQVLESARRIADDKRMTLSEFVSQCLRERLPSATSGAVPAAGDEVQLTPPTEGFPFYTFPKTGNTIRSEDVRKAIEEDGVEEHLDLQARLKAELDQ